MTRTVTARRRPASESPARPNWATTQAEQHEPVGAKAGHGLA